MYLYILIVFIFLSIPTQSARFIEIESPEYPSSMRAGSPQWIAPKENFLIYVFSEKKRTPTKIKNKLFFAPNLYGPNTNIIYGISKSADYNFLGFNSINWFKAKIHIEKLELESAVKIKIPEKRWKRLASEDSEEKKRQSKMLRELTNDSDRELVDPCFSPPLVSKIVSRFGSPRTLPNGKSYYHTGSDLRATMKTEIVAAGSGVVNFTGDLIVPGKTLVIDHGSGIFTRYFHLSDFKVSNGEQVTKGQLIALSGKSGRVEAPHLHWEVVWKGLSINPFEFLDQINLMCNLSNS